MNKEILKNIPKCSGVYLFKDKENNIIYVGKAKSIRHRVISYFKNKNLLDLKTKLLVEEVEQIDHIITKNEEEALLLEAQLIKSKQPRYNQLLKNGQPFIYFLFTNDAVPKLKIVRNKTQKGIYFGPFIRKKEIRWVHEYLIRAFQLKICNQKIASGCLDYHIGICSGYCTDQFKIEDYLFRMELIKKILNGDNKSLTKDIMDQIVQLNKNLEFERAKALHEYLKKIDHIINVINTHFYETKYASNIALVSSSMSQQKITPDYIGIQLKNFLNIDKEPKTIDCFDISHFQSQSIVGSCIRFTNGIPEKNKFRRFKIKTLQIQNDYAALQEIVSRRYRDINELPDLVVIDGGKGQLNAVQELFPQTNFVSIAKREEILFSTQHITGIHLDVKTEVGKLLIALRDYAHHFAITYHRLKKRKSY